MYQYVYGEKTMEPPLNIKIVCSHCHQPSENIKRFRIMWILFMFFAAGSETHIITACDRCMRRKIVINAVFNILTANILWPFIILPMSIYQFIRTYEPGHDDSVLAEIREFYRSSTLSKKPGIKPGQFSALAALVNLSRRLLIMGIHIWVHTILPEWPVLCKVCEDGVF